MPEGQSPDWERAGGYLEQRIRELGTSKKAVAARAGIDTSSLWKVRKGKIETVSEQLRRDVDRAVRWPEGTIDRIAHDPTYEPPSAILSDPERLDLLERRVEELAERLERLLDD